MDEPSLTEAEANAINEQMVRQMAERRNRREERRHGTRAVAVDRRRICSYCFQPGDHPTAAHCRSALERSLMKR